MQLTKCQQLILRTCDRDGHTNLKRIRKVLTNYGSSLASCIRRGWMFDSGEDHGKGWFVLTIKGGEVLRKILGRQLRCEM